MLQVTIYLLRIKLPNNIATEALNCYLEINRTIRECTTHWLCLFPSFRSSDEEFLTSPFELRALFVAGVPRGLTITAFLPVVIAFGVLLLLPDRCSVTNGPHVSVRYVYCFDVRAVISALRYSSHVSIQLNLPLMACS